MDNREPRGEEHACVLYRTLQGCSVLMGHTEMQLEGISLGVVFFSSAILL